MKKLFNLLVFLAFMNVSVMALNVFQPDNISKFETRYMQIHDQYKQSLDPVSFMNINNQRNVRDGFVLLIDVATNFPVSGDPIRYIYEYTPEGYKQNTLVKVLNNGNWEIDSYEICTFDINGNILTSFWRIWDNGSLKNDTYITYSYNENSDMLTYLNQTWTNNSWNNVSQGTYVYNSSGKVVSFLSNVYEDNNWINNSFEVYTYDEFNNMITAVGSIWENNNWVSDRQHTYTYDDNSNLITGLTEMWDETSWVNFYMETYTYNVANKRETYVGELWSNDAWSNINNITYTYDELYFLTMIVEQIWDNNSWLNTNREQYFYETYGGLETVLIEIWDTDVWVNSTLSQNTYDDYGNTTNGEFFNWIDDNWGHTIDGIIRIYYDYSLNIAYFTGYLTEVTYSSIYVDVDEKPSKINSFTCKPNPAKFTTTITTNLKNQSNTEINLYTSTGEKVKNIFSGPLDGGIHSFKILTKSLPTGMYVATIVTNNTTKSLKLIITK